QRRGCDHPDRSENDQLSQNRPPLCGAEPADAVSPWSQTRVPLLECCVKASRGRAMFALSQVGGNRALMNRRPLARVRTCPTRTAGGVAERSNAAVSKTVIRR